MTDLLPHYFIIYPSLSWLISFIILLYTPHFHDLPLASLFYYISLTFMTDLLPDLLPEFLPDFLPDLWLPVTW